MTARGADWFTFAEFVGRSWRTLFLFALEAIEGVVDGEGGETQQLRPTFVELIGVVQVKGKEGSFLIDAHLNIHVRELL
ncbi:MAG: hypothetical protein HY737_02385 [Candidatus Omnitrophica bacterium]|nr:hypothetical protein [Candidatus Omnitrophota bacterium]